MVSDDKLKEIIAQVVGEMMKEAPAAKATTKACCCENVSDDDLEDLKAVDEQCRPQQHGVFLLHGAVLVPPTQQNGGCNHHNHQKGCKD